MRMKAINLFQENPLSKYFAKYVSAIKLWKVANLFAKK